MLKRLPQILLACLLLTSIMEITAPESAAADDGCTVNAASGGGGYNPGVTVSVECGGSPGTGGGAGPVATGCWNWAGEAVPCVYDGFPWQPTLNTYCQLIDASDYYGRRSPNALWWYCHTGPDYTWTPAGPLPATADELAHEAVATLTLHPATTHTGTWEKPQWPSYGPVWWVGAPVWLWIDTNDPHAWGTHTITATENSLTIWATVWATHTTYTLGDGGSITCAGPGTPRPYDPNSLISEHSPTGCEHTYTTTNTLGNPNSRYNVTATVTWRTDWTATNGQTGTFTLTTTGTTTTLHIGQIRIVNQ